MQAETGIIYTIMIVIVSIFSYKIVNSYYKMEKEKNHSDQIDKLRETNMGMKDELHKVKNVCTTYKSKYNSLIKKYDLDLDDMEYNENEDEETKISDLVGAIFPQLPPKFRKLADQKDIQDMVGNIASKNPEKIKDFLSMFAGTKPKSQPEQYGV